MKRKLILAALLLAFAGIAASAQLKLGLRAGFTQSDASLRNVSTKDIAGYHIGLAAQLNLPAGFGLQTGVAYQTKGVKVVDDSGTLDGTITESKTNYGYLEIPLQLQWGLDLIFVRPYVLAEGFAGYALDKKVTQLNGDDFLNVGNSNFKSKFEYGYAFGIGIDIFSFQLSAKWFKNLGDLGEDVTVLGTAGKVIKNKNHFDGLSLSAVFFF